MIHITVNGQPTELERDAMLVEMLRRLGMAEDTAGVAIAVNDAVVPRSGWTTQRLRDGDVVEIIRAVQGG
jgi:sulfur carrier protein